MTHSAAPLSHGWALEVGGPPWVWSLDPVALGLLALAATVYASRARGLRRRGRPFPGLRKAAFGLGLLLVAGALVSPMAALGEERLLVAHMVQHLLVGDLGPLLLILGLTGPLLRPLLALGPVRRLRALAHPLVALPLWVLALYAWHLPAAYEAALGSGAVHLLQHASFFAAGVLMWAALLEPLPGPAWFGFGWKAASVAWVHVAVAALANVFVWADSVVYAPYAGAARLFGLSPLDDQRLAGAAMLGEVTLVGFAVFGWLALRWLAEHERAAILADRGLGPGRAARAARYGRRPAESVCPPVERGSDR